MRENRGERYLSAEKMSSCHFMDVIETIILSDVGRFKIWVMLTTQVVAHYFCVVFNERSNPMAFCKINLRLVNYLSHWISRGKIQLFLPDHNILKWTERILSSHILKDYHLLFPTNSIHLCTSGYLLALNIQNGC